MEVRIKNLSSKLKDLHKRFLENERYQAELYFEKSITPFEFLLMLTQDKNFSWLQPFSAMIAEIDAFTDEAEIVSKEDLICIRDQLEFILQGPNTDLYNRYQYHLNNDADFIMLHSNFKKVMDDFIHEIP